MDAPPESTELKPRWPRFQFSLRTLLLFVTLVGLCLAIPVSRARRQQRAVATIRQLGGHVSYDYFKKREGAGPPSRLATWLCGLCGPDFVMTVDNVQFESPTLADADLDAIVQLSELRWLSIDKSQVTDAGLKKLAGLKQLKRLQIQRCLQVTDAGLAHIEGLTNLEWLELRGTSVTDRGVVHLKGLTKLQKLGLGKFRLPGQTGPLTVEITDAALPYLTDLSHLTDLYLFHTGVTAEGMKELRCVLPELEIGHAP